jgi:hypothetical protein
MYCDDLAILLSCRDDLVLIPRLVAITAPLLVMLIDRGEYELPIPFYAVDIKSVIDLNTLDDHYVTYKALQFEVLSYMCQDKIVPGYIQGEMPQQQLDMLSRRSPTSIIYAMKVWGKLHWQLLRLLGSDVDTLVHFLYDWRSVKWRDICDISPHTMTQEQRDILLLHSNILGIESVSCSIVSMLTKMTKILSIKDMEPYVHWAFGVNGWGEQTKVYLQDFKKDAPGYFEYSEHIRDVSCAIQ